MSGLLAVLVFLALVGGGMVALIRWRRMPKKFWKQPEQDWVTQYVWRQGFGVKQKLFSGWVPAIEWKRGSLLNCDDGRRWTISTRYGADGKLLPGDQVRTMCVAGLMLSSKHVQVSDLALGEDFRFTRTALVHELGHAYLQLTTGDGNWDHRHPIFQPGGRCDQIDSELARWGH